MNRCESSKCRLFVIGNFVGDYTTPERIKCGGRKHTTTTVGIENEIIERKLNDGVYVEDFIVQNQKSNELFVNPKEDPKYRL